MHLSPDQLVFWQHGFFKLNATIVFTWALMLVLVGGAKLMHRPPYPRTQSALAGRISSRSS